MRCLSTQWQPQRPKYGPGLFAALSFMLWISACSSIPSGQLVDQHNLSSSQLLDDLKYIDLQLRTIHPRPFIRLPQEQYLVEFEKTHNALSTLNSRIDFYQQTAPLIASIQDAHTQLQLPGKEFTAFARQQGTFPLKVLISEQKLLVLADEQELPTVPVGAEIISINDIMTDELLLKLGRLVPAETETGRTRMVQVHLAELLWVLMPEATAYTINYRWRGKELTERLQPLPQTAESALSMQRQMAVSHYGQVEINEYTSLLWLNDFNETYDVFEDFLDVLFMDLALEGKTNLIIDLRYNRGGLTDNLKLLLSYLTPRDIQWADHASLKVSPAFRKRNERLIENAKSEKYSSYFGWLPVEYFNLWQWELLFSDEGELLEASIGTEIESQTNYFKGNIIVLSNGYCFSACVALLSNLKKHKLATIIGESPGNYIGSQFGYPIQVTLPNTGLNLTIPAMELVLYEGEGSETLLEPDYHVSRRKIDVLMGYDVVLQSALELIKLETQLQTLPKTDVLH